MSWVCVSESVRDAKSGGVTRKARTTGRSWTTSRYARGVPSEFENKVYREGDLVRNCAERLKNDPDMAAELRSEALRHSNDQ